MSAAKQEPLAILYVTWLKNNMCKGRFQKSYIDILSCVKVQVRSERSFFYNFEFNVFRSCMKPSVRFRLFKAFSMTSCITYKLSKIFLEQLLVDYSIKRSNLNCIFQLCFLIFNVIFSFVKQTEKSDI